MIENKYKIILHLCAKMGSDSQPYKDAGYDVKIIGEDIGVENYNPPPNVYGIIANPPCTEFSTARESGKARNNFSGLYLVEHCKRIINLCNPKFWLIENPAKGILKKYLGNPKYQYEPWWFGSPWTKKTALWGNFNIPKRKYYKWNEVQKIEGLYIRPNRSKPSLAFMHKSHIKYIKEFNMFNISTDADFRSLCSQNFAKAFFEANP